jgi:NitT/TauT family transport system ATP-binding protein
MIELIRETSWATLRDRIAVRHLDVAHMLGPMPIADILGLTPLPIGLIVPITLGYGGNTITVSSVLWRELAAEGAPDTGEAAPAASAMARIVASRRWSARPRLTFAIVHPYSAHHYQLAYWLGWAGISPGVDVEFVVLPPSLMTAALASGQIDGFCVGDPWGSAAMVEGAGRVLTTSAHIWENAPDKVLGISRAFAEEQRERVAPLVRAIYRAACWCDDPANHPDLARLLAEPALVGQPAEVIQAALARRPGAPVGGVASGPSFLAFAANGATYPRRSHAAWFYAQMVRWGQVRLDEALAAKATSVYRSDIYRAALAPLDIPLPVDDRGNNDAGRVLKTTRAGRGEFQLGVDTFFDGRTFDPDRIGDYLRQFARD